MGLNFSLPGSYYEPPDPPMECLWCDGQRLVCVSAIVDSSNKIHELEAKHQFMYETNCPRCAGSGVEPEPDEFDDPRIP